MVKSKKMEGIDHNSLLTLSKSGVVKEVFAIGQKDGWQVSIKYGNVEQSLSSIRSKKARIFKNLETAIFYLKDLGINEVIVKVLFYDKKLKKIGKIRPDRSEALKKAYAVIKSSSKSKKTKIGKISINN